MNMTLADVEALSLEKVEGTSLVKQGDEALNFPIQQSCLCTVNGFMAQLLDDETNENNNSCTFRQSLSLQPMDPETTERLRSVFVKAIEGVACKAAMGPSQVTGFDYAVDSLYAGATDVIALLKETCESPCSEG